MPPAPPRPALIIRPQGTNGTNVAGARTLVIALAAWLRDNMRAG